MGVYGVEDRLTAACKIEELKFVEENTKHQLDALRMEDPALRDHARYQQAFENLRK